MYLTATSAAWRYSGKVTGPASMFSRPSTTGEPDAFLGLPSASAAGAAACVEAALAAVEVEPPSSSLLPQAARTAGLAGAAAIATARTCRVFMRSPPPWERHGTHVAVLRVGHRRRRRRGTSTAAARARRAGARRGPRARDGHG